jgi:hypothetical protein
MLELSTSSRFSAEFWHRSLMQIPTLFGRLVYLSSLLDGATGRYVHPNLTHLVGSDQAERTLRSSHFQVFSQWLAASLEDQKNDLDEYLRTVGGSERKRFRELVPPTAREVERHLYLADIETLLELLNFERDGEAPVQASWPRQ